MSKRILLIGDANSVHIHGLVAALKRKSPNIIIDIIPNGQVVRSPNVDRVYNFTLLNLWQKLGLKGGSIIRNIEFLFISLFVIKSYDVIQIHSVAPYLHLFIRILKIKASRVVPVFWGSDVFRLEEKNVAKLKEIIDVSGRVNCTTKEMQEELKKRLGYVTLTNLSTCRFGIQLIDILSEKLYHKINKVSFLNKIGYRGEIEPSKIITIGYNGAPQQQHLEIIEELEKLDDTSVIYLFPMAYGGSSEYHDTVIKRLNESNVLSIVILDFLDTDDVARLRLLTDVFIQLQTTDALSAATQEHLYAGNRVITGFWLPYNKFKELGLTYKTIDSVDQLSVTLKAELKTECLSNDIKQNNRRTIENLSSWDILISDWLEL